MVQVRVRLTAWNRMPTRRRRFFRPECTELSSDYESREKTVDGVTSREIRCKGSIKWPFLQRDDGPDPLAPERLRTENIIASTGKLSAFQGCLNGHSGRIAA